MELYAITLSEGLRDTIHPAVCVACAMCFCVFTTPSFDETKKDPKKAILRELRVHHGELWNRIMRLLTVKRNPESRQAVNRRLNQILTSCDSFFWSIDTHSRLVSELKKDKNMLVPLIECSAEILHNLMRGLGMSSKLLEAQRFSDHGHWPAGPDDLLPYGHAESLSTLIFWLTVTTGPSISSAFLSIMRACHHELLPHLRDPPTRRLFTKAICKRIDIAVEDARTGRPVGVAEWGLRTWPIPRIHVLVELLDHLLTLTHDIGDFEHAQTDSYVKGVETDVINSLEAAITVIDTDQGRVRLALLADTAYESLGTPKALRSDIVAKHLRTVSMGSAFAFRLLYFSINNVREKRVCSNCKRTEHELGRSLNRCAGCGVVPYCSKECQKAHWKVEIRAHQDVCSLIQEILPFMDRFETWEDFSREALALNLSPANAAFVVENLDAVNSIGRYQHDISPEGRMKSLQAFMEFFMTPENETLTMLVFIL